MRNAKCSMRNGIVFNENILLLKIKKGVTNSVTPFAYDKIQKLSLIL